MATQMELAKRGVLSEEMRYVAEREGVSADFIRRRVAEGRIIIPKNVARELPPLGIGEGLRVKVNANIGTSRDLCDVDRELRKAEVAVEAGADTLMDLSTGGDLDEIRRRILREVEVPLGTVPIYQAAVEAQMRHGAIINMTEDDIFNVIERHARDGVDFMTVHCGVTKESVERVIRQNRLLGIVSRGGTFLTAWILHNGEENPLYTNYDYLLEIAEEYDVTLSLGDGLRPGCIHDATDAPQLQELLILGELVDRARERGVQTMVEGPGHLPLDHIEANVRLEKTLCKGAPFYVLGPLVTDVAPGYDHIVGAIGGALAAMAGADFLCYVTPSEHLALPDVEDVREGVIAARIAAHAADLVRRRELHARWDYEISKARADLDWERHLKLALDPVRARRIREERAPGRGEVCTMCGEFCAIKLLREYLLHAEH
ncbi:MAG: phosphomethylpyrimidine synthase [Candidatus Bathyarchaeota archaeon B23]|nr:MAG: phosphomethylpyrimidine synthase [Candidatus Bathyarchaeota archaeon B23]